MNKDKFTRDLNMRSPDWRAGALQTELTCSILVVFLFCQYLCLGAPVISHSTIAQITIQPGKRQKGDTTFFYKYHVINHKENWLGTFLDKFWTNKDKLIRAGFEPATPGVTCLFPGCIVPWAWSWLKAVYGWMTSDWRPRTKILTK